jgi:hypothetical protein
MKKLPEGTKIIANLGSELITGEICGIINELPVVGYIYIIRITGQKGKAWDYPYSCIALPQSCFVQK